MALGSKTSPFIGVRSSEKRLNTLYNLEKWNTLVFLCSKTSPNFIRREEITL